MLFSVISVIKCSQHCLAGTSMSQVVDRIVLDKIQFGIYENTTRLLVHF